MLDKHLLKEEEFFEFLIFLILVVAGTTVTVLNLDTES